MKKKTAQDIATEPEQKRRRNGRASMWQKNEYVPQVSHEM